MYFLIAASHEIYFSSIANDSTSCSNSVRRSNAKIATNLPLSSNERAECFCPLEKKLGRLACCHPVRRGVLNRQRLDRRPLFHEWPKLGRDVLKEPVIVTIHICLRLP